MRHVLFGAALLALLASGCGSEAAKMKGRLVEHGQPKEFPPTVASVQFTLIVDGKPNPSKSYPAVVNTDGTFEVLASGGQLPPGTYEVEIRGPIGDKKGAAPLILKREIKAGQNELTIDVAKPDG